MKENYLKTISHDQIQNGFLLEVVIFLTLYSGMLMYIFQVAIHLPSLFQNFSLAESKEFVSFYLKNICIR